MWILRTEWMMLSDAYSGQEMRSKDTAFISLGSQVSAGAECSQVLSRTRLSQGQGQVPKAVSLATQPVLFLLSTAYLML